MRLQFPTMLRFAGYAAILIFSARGVSSVWHLHSSPDYKTAKTFLSQHGLFIRNDPIQRLESIDGATTALTVATQLHGKYFNAMNKNLSLVVTPPPFDRFIPNSLGMQWAIVTAPSFGPTDFRSLTEFLSALEHDQRLIGRHLYERLKRRSLDEPDWMVLARLNDVLRHERLATSSYINNLSLDEETVALIRYPNLFFDSVYLNRRIIEQAYPHDLFHDLLEESDIINWQALNDDIQSMSNPIAALLHSALSKAGKIPIKNGTRLNASTRQLIRFELNRLIQADTTLIPLDATSRLSLRKETVDAMITRQYGRNLIRLNRMLLEDILPNAIRRGGARIDSSFDYSPYYPAVAIGVDLGNYTLIQKNSFWGSINAGDGIWFRPAKNLFTPLPSAGDWSIPFSEDLAHSKEVLIWATGSFSDGMDFGTLAFETEVLSDDSWYVSNESHAGWNDKHSFENTYWRLSSSKGNYGDIFMKFPILPATNAKWIGRDSKHKPSTDSYYRKTVRLKAPLTGALKISGVNRYQLFINGHLIGSGEHWNAPGNFNVTLKDGDVIGVHLYVDDGLNDALLLDFQGKTLNGWRKSSVQAGYVGLTTFLIKELDENEIRQARLNGKLDLSDLAQYQLPGRKFSYYISPFRKESDH